MKVRTYERKKGKEKKKKKIISKPSLNVNIDFL